MALREVGINTSPTKRISRMKITPIHKFLNEDWSEEVHGRSPTVIAEMGGFRRESVVASLRRRRDYLSNKAERIEVPELIGFITFSVDPYKMTVKFIGTKKKGYDSVKVITIDEMLTRLASC